MMPVVQKTRLKYWRMHFAQVPVKKHHHQSLQHWQSATAKMRKT